MAPGACFEEGQVQEALAFIDNNPDMLVVKGDGLAGGKAVVVADDPQAAKAAVIGMMVDKQFDGAGRRIVIQKRLVGREISFHVLVSRTGYKILCSVQDYKKAPNGLNGGGQGGKDVEIVDWIMKKFIEKILFPTLEAFKIRSIVYEGVLYFGCLLNDADQDLYVLEYNCRFGDPELQVILAKLKTSFLEVLLAIFDDRLSTLDLQYSDDHVVLTVGCTRGYPGTILKQDKNQTILGLDQAAMLPAQRGYVLLPGAAQDGDRIVNVSGRVTNNIGLGKTYETAASNSYLLSQMVNFEGMWVQPGIGITI